MTRDTIAILSGKGGVGKSTVSWNLALNLRDKGYRIGLLDADIHNPNLPQIASINPIPELEYDLREDRLIPYIHKDIKVISLAFTIPEAAPVLWKGKQKREAVEQLIRLTKWKDIDYLIIDCPAGTGEELMATLATNVTGAIVVTTPHAAAIGTAPRAVSALREYQTKLIGLIINMAKLHCPNCKTIIDFPFPDIFDKELILTEIPFRDDIRQENIIPGFDQIANKIIERLEVVKNIDLEKFYNDSKFVKLKRLVTKRALNFLLSN